MASLLSRPRKYSVSHLRLFFVGPMKFLLQQSGPSEANALRVKEFPSADRPCIRLRRNHNRRGATSPGESVES